MGSCAVGQSSHVLWVKSLHVLWGGWIGVGEWGSCILHWSLHVSWGGCRADGLHGKFGVMLVSRVYSMP
jgi:hypothetical protein